MLTADGHPKFRQQKSALEFKVHHGSMQTRTGDQLEVASEQAGRCCDFDDGVCSAVRFIGLEPSREKAGAIRPVFEGLASKTGALAAGFLFGCGLVRHVGWLDTDAVYDLLCHNDPLLTSALLLALGFAHQGTRRSDLVKLINVHVDGYFSPWKRVDLDISLDVQTASVLGLGLLHTGSRDPRVGAFLLKSMQKRGVVAPHSKTVYGEAYALASGVAYGLLHLTDTAGDPVCEGVSHHEVALLLDMVNHRSSAFVPAAVMALLGALLHTEGAEAAAKLIEIAVEETDLDGERPHEYMLKILCRMLLCQSAALVREDECMAVVLGTWAAKDRAQYLQLVYACHALAAAALYHGIVGAGTNNRLLFERLLAWLQALRTVKATSQYAVDWESLRIKSPIVFLHDHVLLALSLLASGTSDRQLLSILRLMYADPLDFHYGRGLLYHTAVGFLSVGQGALRVCGDTSKRQYMLVCALMRLVAAVPEDQQMYPPMLRYFWIECVERRMPDGGWIGRQLEGGAVGRRLAEEYGDGAPSEDDVVEARVVLAFYDNVWPVLRRTRKLPMLVGRQDLVCLRRRAVWCGREKG